MMPISSAANERDELNDLITGSKERLSDAAWRAVEFAKASTRHLRTMPAPLPPEDHRQEIIQHLRQARTQIDRALLQVEAWSEYERLLSELI